MNNSKVKISSNRSFGLVFFIIFIAISFWPLTNGGSIRVWSIFVSLILLILAILNSKLLSPLNKLWYKLGLALGSIVAPIVMGIILFLVVTPIGLFMRILGKDLLRKKINKKVNSYWINRDKAVSTMKHQF